MQVMANTADNSKSQAMVPNGQVQNTDMNVEHLLAICQGALLPLLKDKIIDTSGSTGHLMVPSMWY